LLEYYWPYTELHLKMQIVQKTGVVLRNEDLHIPKADGYLGPGTGRSIFLDKCHGKVFF
jgi:hypothetical protein